MTDVAQMLRAEFKRARDPKKAAGAQAYMKSAMPYWGVATPEMRAICRRVFAAKTIPTASRWRAECLRLWRGAQFREERYAALELRLTMDEEMIVIVSGAWWDFVDLIASRRLGPLLRQYPAQMRKKMLQWSRAKNMWKRRSAILCQLSCKKDTDLDLLCACLEPSLASKEFFLQKAIGWALR